MDSFVIHKSPIKQPLYLNYLILQEMADVRNHKNWSLPYATLLTKNFEHFRVSFRDQYDQHIDEGFTTYMISRGITIDSSDNEENEEGDEEENE